LGEPRQIVGRPKLAHQPGRMPGGSRGDLLTLEHDDVSHAPQCEMIGDAASDDAATHDDDLRVSWKIGHPDLLMRDRGTGAITPISRIRIEWEGIP
jgi:hypothetical protein